MKTEKVIEIVRSHIGHCKEGANPMYALGYETGVCNVMRDINGEIQRGFSEDKKFTAEQLIGNEDNGLDHFLLHSAEHSQEEREVIMEAVANWYKGVKES